MVRIRTQNKEKAMMWLESLDWELAESEEVRGTASSHAVAEARREKGGPLSVKRRKATVVRRRDYVVTNIPSQL